MTEHLPECRYVVFQQQGQIPEAVIPMGCICPALRACEQRVTEQHNAKHEDDRLAAFTNGYAAGVQAARDAVPHDDGCLSNDADADARDCNCWQPVALAAIDALRWES